MGRAIGDPDVRDALGDSAIDGVGKRSDGLDLAEARVGVGPALRIEVDARRIGWGLHGLRVATGITARTRDVGIIAACPIGVCSAVRVIRWVFRRQDRLRACARQQRNANSHSNFRDSHFLSSVLCVSELAHISTMPPPKW